MFVIVYFLLQISISKAWSSRCFPCVTSSFRTFSCSPSNGPFVISAKPYLMITPNVNNVPVILSPDENCTSQIDINEVTAQEITGIEGENIQMDVEESTTDIETVSADENEMKIDDTMFYNDPVEPQNNLEYTEKIENSDFENTPPLDETPVQVD